MPDAAKAEGYNAVTVVTVVDDKAHYYPGASNFITNTLVLEGGTAFNDLT